MPFEVVDIGTQNDLQDDAWKSMIDATSEFSDDFMEERNQPTDQQQRESFE